MNLTIAQRTIIYNTITIEREYPVSPERVFAAFADPAQKRRWYAEGDARDLEVFEMDFRPGGTDRPGVPCFGRPEPAGNRGEAQPGSALGVEPGWAAGDYGRGGSAAPAGVGGERTGAHGKTGAGADVPDRTGGAVGG